MVNLDLSGRRALVMGASRGIGKATALVLAKAGAQICLAARNESALQQVHAQLCTDANQTHHYLVVDHANHEMLHRQVSSYAADHPIDILVNNSGGPRPGPVHNADIGAFASAFHQHVLSAQLLTCMLLPYMRRQRFGRIINIISTSAKQPIDNLGVSNTVRAAMANWAKTLANEMAPYQITVNNVLPGATLTERLVEIIQSESAHHKNDEEAIKMRMLDSIPMKRFAKPEEIAYAIAFLASPLASYITGINLPIDGGRTKSL